MQWKSGKSGKLLDDNVEGDGVGHVYIFCETFTQKHPTENLDDRAKGVSAETQAYDGKDLIIQVLELPHCGELLEKIHSDN